MLEKARDLRAAGKLKDAIAQMSACNACPALADVCDQTRASMSAALPTLRVHARTCDGDALDAIVTIDGIAGARATLDPGWHDVRAEVGARAEEQSVFIAEGEHKSVSLVIAGAPRPMPLAVPVLVGTSVAALGAAGALWAVSLSAPARLVAMYPAALNGPLVEDATQRDFAVAAGVALAASVTVIVTALVVYLTRPFPRPKSPD